MIFDWQNIMIGPGGLLISISHIFACSPGFSFMGGVAKEKSG